MDWRRKAECIGTDPELFFPLGNTDAALRQTEQAKAVCRRCEVIDECREWALETRQDIGVWGGTSERDRRKMRRSRDRRRRWRADASEPGARSIPPAGSTSLDTPQRA